jgi:hypothetical protein
VFRVKASARKAKQQKYLWYKNSTVQYKHRRNNLHLKYVGSHERRE